MKSRIELSGGNAEFLKRLDSYFGIDAKPVEQLRMPPWDKKRAAGIALGRFDGVNNEVAIETPFAYMYTDKLDSTAEIIRAAMKYHFSDSSGGLPGNDDSGALSSWFVWNAVGLYPVPGQGTFFIGSPLFDSARLSMGERCFEVRVTREGQEAIYLKAVILNGVSLKRAFLYYHEVLFGGHLSIELINRKEVFIVDELPPSYRRGHED